MDLIDRVREIASRIPQQQEHIQTEEATKNAFVMPFISAPARPGSKKNFTLEQHNFDKQNHVVLGF